MIHLGRNLVIGEERIKKGNHFPKITLGHMEEKRPENNQSRLRGTAEEIIHDILD